MCTNGLRAYAIKEDRTLCSDYITKMVYDNSWLAYHKDNVHCPPNAISFWNQLAGAAGAGVLIRAAVGGMGPDRAKQASSNFTIALLISCSVMIRGGTKRTTLGPAGTTNIPAARRAFAT